MFLTNFTKPGCGFVRSYKLMTDLRTVLRSIHMAKRHSFSPPPCKTNKQKKPNLGVKENGTDDSVGSILPLHESIWRQGPSVLLQSPLLSVVASCRVELKLQLHGGEKILPTLKRKDIIFCKCTNYIPKWAAITFLSKLPLHIHLGTVFSFLCFLISCVMLNCPIQPMRWLLCKDWWNCSRILEKKELLCKVTKLKPLHGTKCTVLLI